MVRGHIAAAIALAFAFAHPAQAVALAADGQWATFDVAQDLSGTLGWIDIGNGSALSFTFTIPAGSIGTLTVVDGGFAGDRFQVTRTSGQTVGTTSAAVNTYPGTNVGLDFDAALANPAYSRGIFAMSSGNYTVSGLLVSSALDGSGMPLNSTVGGIRLVVTAVPEPASAATLIAGLGLLAAALRRRAS